MSPKIQPALPKTTAAVELKTLDAPIKPEAPPPKPSAPPGSGFDKAKEKFIFTGTNPALKRELKGDPRLAAEVKLGKSHALLGGSSPPKAEPAIYGASKGFGHPSSRGPISAADWANPTQLVGKLTQTPAGGATKQSGASCSASNLIGAALLSGGSGAAANVLQKVATGANQLTANEKKELQTIADKVKNHTATFGDLNKAQELVYRSANTELSVRDLLEDASKNLKPPERKELAEKLAVYNKGVMSQEPKDKDRINDLLSKGLGVKVDFTDTVGDGMVSVPNARRAVDGSGLTDGELQKLGGQAVGGKAQSVGADPTIEKLAKTLKPGEALTVRVSGGPDPKHPNAAEQADHYVTIGRREDGRLYVYNPDPGNKDATLVLGGKTVDAAFLQATDQYNDRFIKDGNSLPDALKYSPK